LQTSFKKKIATSLYPTSPTSHICSQVIPLLCCILHVKQMSKRIELTSVPSLCSYNTNIKKRLKRNRVYTLNMNGVPTENSSQELINIQN